MEGTFADTATAVVAKLCINFQLAVCVFLRRMDRTILLQLAFFAGTAILDMILRHSCAHDAQIVQGRLDAVIGTAACCDLEFMRQGYPTIALIEACMDFIAQRIGIIQTILTGGCLAGNHRTHLAACTADGKPCLCQMRAEGINIMISNPRNLNRQTGGHHHVSITIKPCRFRNDTCFLCGNASVSGDDASVEQIRALMLQKAHALYALDILGAQGTALRRSLALQLINKFLQCLCGQLHRIPTAFALCFILRRKRGTFRCAERQLLFKCGNKIRADCL